jgi:hypothetical protein
MVPSAAEPAQRARRRIPKKIPGEGNAGLSGMKIGASEARYKNFFMQIENNLKTQHAFEAFL